MYPKRVCPACLGEDLGWREASGRGEVYTVTVQMAGPPSGFEDRLPYVLAVIRLEEGVQMMSNLVGPGSMEARCGDPVVADFETAGEVTLPVFRLAAAKAGGASMSASDLVAVITGGAQGIGASAGRHLAARGYRIHAIDRRPSSDPGVTSHICDVTDDVALADLASRIGPIDVLVPAAGINLAPTTTRRRS